MQRATGLGLSLFVSIAMLAITMPAGPALAQEDIAGATDHPLVGRYQGSVITFHETKAYEELTLPDATPPRNYREAPDSFQTELAGKLTSIRYEGPADRSILEVMRNYEKALKDDGFEILFSCRGKKECAPNTSSVAPLWDAARGGIGMPSTWDSTLYTLARKDDPAGQVTVGLLGVETRASNTRSLTPHVAMTIVEGEPMQTDQIVLVEASAMESAIAKDGKIAVYGINFDFDKADITPDSKPQIDELGKLLTDNPELAVLIVGHTDGEGGFDYNLSLSQRRAQAVVDALARDYGIAATRLQPAGAGPVSPVASNRTEDGRAKNRRVEIVERYKG
ncbi:OmpA family protein [Aurantimonas marianensis]|uniref:OmpA family protein n=1 Tax=Aurantimonas marianensis TaxID=2920428 RepID=A0A9X2KJJ0_9HYPH|nr:OmpA family protein [Aurantimonas marianensis]MCP3056727.1 OmpA family protein [Aurantimonas marianensis]